MSQANARNSKMLRMMESIKALEENRETRHGGGFAVVSIPLHLLMCGIRENNHHFSIYVDARSGSWISLARGIQIRALRWSYEYVRCRLDRKGISQS